MHKAKSRAYECWMYVIAVSLPFIYLYFEMIDIFLKARYGIELFIFFGAIHIVTVMVILDLFFRRIKREDFEDKKSELQRIKREDFEDKKGELR
jgi:nitrogen fixation-related uncharacterized protein